MKAKEWVVRLKQVPAGEQPVEERFAEFLKEYGEETANLVFARTRTSKSETLLSAADGAVREQRNKFRSICSSFPLLSETLFDAILNDACPNYLKLVQANQEKAKESDDVTEYRKSWRKPKGHREPETT